MADRMAHRGPDGEESYFAEGVGLGVRRLAIRSRSRTRGGARSTSRVADSGVKPLYSPAHER